MLWLDKPIPRIAYIMRHLLPILALTALITPLAPAAVVTFTGGTAYGNMTFFDVNFTPTSVTSGVTDGTKTFRQVDY